MSTTVKFKGGHTHGVLCVEALHDGSMFVSGGENGEICLWDRYVIICSLISLKTVFGCLQPGMANISLFSQASR